MRVCASAERALPAAACRSAVGEPREELAEIDTVVKVAARVGGAARPRDVVPECLHQIAAYDGLLGAFQRVRWERAVVEADELAGRSILLHCRWPACRSRSRTTCR